MLAMTVRPAAASRLEDLHQVLLGRGVDARDRFVEQVQVRLGREGPAEEHAPALAAREGADLASILTGHADGLEGLLDSLPIGCRRRSAEPDERHATHHHHVAHRDRERPVDELGLRHIGDPPRLAAGRAAEHLDRARDRFDEPGDRLEERALARPVRPDDREQRPGPDLEIDVLEGDPVAVRHGHVVEGDGHDRGRGLPDRVEGAGHFRAFTISSTSQVISPM